MAARWTEERVARELDAWFAQQCFGRWPPYSALAAIGLKRLHAALMRTGGPSRWALEVGVPLGERTRGRWLSDDELRALLREHRPQRFPSQRWLAEHRPPGIVGAVRPSGGSVRWATELGMAHSAPRRWTGELLERELRTVCAGRATWPSEAEFQAARATGVLRAVRMGHGSRWCAERLGFEVVEGSGRDAVGGQAHRAAPPPKPRTPDSPIGEPAPARARLERDAGRWHRPPPARWAFSENDALRRAADLDEGGGARRIVHAAAQQHVVPHRIHDDIAVGLSESVATGADAPQDQRGSE